MSSHMFGPIQHTSSVNDQPYYRCQYCGRVMFANGDSLFNQHCNVAANNLEQLRDQLEKQSPQKEEK